MQREDICQMKRPSFSVGFNYHPSNSGCQYWQQWDPQRIEQDLKEMARRGFNTVRFFIFWADVEPTAGNYDATIIERVQQFVSIAQQHKLWCIPALLTIWMNGQLFDLPWRAGRDLWTNSDMIEREVQYIRQISLALRSAQNILAYDLGDELIHVDLASAQRLSRSQVRFWQQTLADALHQSDADAFILQGNEASTVLGNHEFRPENSQALDILALHGFPIWTPFAIESAMSYKSTLLVSFLVQYSRIDGPVLIDELGSYGTDDEVADAFLRATTHSALANGAQGMIVWCWQDFTARVKPFDKHPNERFVGLLTSDGNAKPPMQTFEQLARSTQHEWAGLSLAPASIGVYIPEREEQTGLNYLQAHTSPASAAFYAFLLLKRSHLPSEFTRAPLSKYALILCPSIEHITLHEQEALKHYVEQGGTLYYSAADYLHGFGGEDLFGVRLKDFTLNAQEMSHFIWQEQEYSIHWPTRGQAYPRIPLLKTSRAEVLAIYPNGSPALTYQTYGKGQVYYLNAPLELQLDEPFRLHNLAWHKLYEYIAQQAGIFKEIDVSSAEIEIAVMHKNRQHYAFLINHAIDTVEFTFTRYSLQKTIIQQSQLTLTPKEVQVLSWEDAMQPPTAAPEYNASAVL